MRERNKQVSFWVTPEEHRRIGIVAAREGLSRSDWMRRAALGEAVDFFTAWVRQYLASASPDPDLAAFAEDWIADEERPVVETRAELVAYLRDQKADAGVIAAAERLWRLVEFAAANWPRIADAALEMQRPTPAAVEDAQARPVYVRGQGMVQSA